MDTSGSKELQLRAPISRQLSSVDKLGYKVLPDVKNLHVIGGKGLKDQSVLPHMLTSSIFPSDFYLF